MERKEKGKKKNKVMRYLFIILLVIPLLHAERVSAENTNQTEIFARHGILEEVPENTFVAFERVVDLGIDGIFVDIRKTKDGRLILMTDETVERTTNGKGKVDQLLYAEIQQLDAGSWRGSVFENEHVPLLSDVLMFCKINKLKLILNVKQLFIESEVLDLVRTYEMSSHVYFWGTMRNYHADKRSRTGKELIFIPPGEVTEEKIGRIHEDKKYAFTIMQEDDDRTAMKKILQKHIDVLLIDYPHVVLDIMNIKRQINTTKDFKQRGVDPGVQVPDGGGRYLKDEIQNLIHSITNDNYDKARSAAIALKVFPPNHTIPPLLRLLENRDSQVRQNAVWALALCHEGMLSPYLHPLLQDRDKEVRRETVLALKRIGSDQSLPMLVKALKTETDQGVKYDIARTLGTLGYQSTTYVLIEELMKKNNTWTVKSACVEALGKIGREKALKPLTHVLITDAGETASWARTKAAWALAATGKKSVPFLIEALKDNEEPTRRRAQWALVKIGTPAVKSLINALRDINKQTRARAAQSLGWIGDRKSVTALIWALKDKETIVVRAAAWALGRIGDRKALVALQTLIHNKSDAVRDCATEAIERISGNNINEDSKPLRHGEEILDPLNPYQESDIKPWK